MIDLSSPELQSNPYSTYNLAREESPICEIAPGGTWMITRYADVKKYLLDGENFTASQTPELFSKPWLSEDCQSDFYLFVSDLSEYHARRSAITHPFTKKNVTQLRPEIEVIADSVIGELKTMDCYDFVSDFSYKFVGSVMSRLTGLDELQDVDQIHKWMRVVEDLPFIDMPDRDTKERIESIIRKQKTNLYKIVNNRQRQTGEKDDIVSRLIHGELRGEKLSPEQLINAVELIIRAGFQTTVHLLSNAVVELIERRYVCNQLIESPELIPAFVDELLRLRSSLAFARRTTTSPITVHGFKLEKDTKVLLCIASANRDPRVFNNPDDYDFFRKNKEHIGFGYGAHICLGMHLARTEVEVAMSKLIHLIPAMTCPPANEIKWTISPTMRGIEELPISLLNPQ